MMNEAKHAAGRPALPEMAFPSLKRRLWLPALGGGLALAGLAAGTLTLSQPAVVVAPTAAPVPTGLTVGLATVTPVDWPLQIRADGPIEAWQEATVATAVAGLPLVGLEARLGQRVRIGQRLAQYDVASLLADRAFLDAELAQAKAALAEAEANLRRAERLAGTSTLSEKSLMEARTQAATRRAQMAAAEARLATVRLQIERASILSPADGTITARPARLGAVSASGEELFRLIVDDRLEWRAQLTVEQAGGTAAGQAVEVTLPDGGKAAGRLRELAPTVDGNTRLLTAFVDLHPGSGARAGMYATGDIQRRPATVLVAPAESVVVRDGHSYLFRLDRDAGTAIAELQPVVTGRQRDGRIEIIQGARSGDRVAVEGAGFLEPGQNVRVVPSAGEKP